MGAATGWLIIVTVIAGDVIGIDAGADDVAVIVTGVMDAIDGIGIAVDIETGMSGMEAADVGVMDSPGFIGITLGTCTLGVGITIGAD